MRIETVQPSQYAALGDLTVAAYRALPGRPTSDRYAAMLRDVAGRAQQAEVVVALDEEDGTVLGGVTCVGSADSELAEFAAADEAGFRMLAVAGSARSRGVGRALVEACIERARRDAKARLTLQTTANMRDAHRLYERLGFRRTPDSDIIVENGLHLMAYTLDL